MIKTSISKKLIQIRYVFVIEPQLPLIR